MGDMESKVGELAEILKTTKVAKMQIKPEASLEHFYSVRDMNKRTGKEVLKYVYNEDIHKEHGLVIVPITDVHLGSHHSNVAYFKAFVDHILSVPNCVTILNGDLAETATKISVGAAMFEESDHLPKQLSALYQLLKPLADAGKILGVLPGNHEERVYQMIGINPMEILADKLGVPYMGYQAYFVTEVNGIKYRISSYHGSGGGSSNGAKTTSAEKIAKVVPNADLYISGHTHGRMWHEDVVYMFDEKDQLVPHRRIFAVCGSFVEYWSGYAEMKGLPPSITGLLRFELRPDRKDIRVTM